MQVEKEIEELGNVSEETVAASAINEKLLETLQLHKEKVFFNEIIMFLILILIYIGCVSIILTLIFIFQ